MVFDNNGKYQKSIKIDVKNPTGIFYDYNSNLLYVGSNDGKNSKGNDPNTH
jgi:hypothetical protein